ncbi:MAG: hypothetical protein JWO06_2009, partial [Bacteroidota bacterium]|nr:hypothetical protein [Bacteroidota bacterium]
MKSNRIIIILAIALVSLIVIYSVGKKAGWFGKGDVLEVAVDKA